MQRTAEEVTTRGSRTAPPSDEKRPKIVLLSPRLERNQYHIIVGANNLVGSSYLIFVSMKKKTNNILVPCTIEKGLLMSHLLPL